MSCWHIHWNWSFYSMSFLQLSKTFHYTQSAVHHTSSDIPNLFREYFVTFKIWIFMISHFSDFCYLFCSCFLVDFCYWKSVFCLNHGIMQFLAHQLFWTGQVHHLDISDNLKTVFDSPFLSFHLSRFTSFQKYPVK